MVSLVKSTPIDKIELNIISNKNPRFRYFSVHPKSDDIQH